MSPFVTVTIGRNRRPGSKTAPDAPLTVKQWYDFRNDILAVLVTMKSDGSWVETFQGHEEWKGVPEQRMKFTLYKADVSVNVTEQLKELAGRYDQDVIELGRGTIHLVKGDHP